MKKYDVIIVGGGISGVALLYTLSNFTSIKNIALIEKYHELGIVNTKSSQNSQTLHFGDIETNYTLEKSIKVKKSTEMLRKYLELTSHKGLFTIYNKMVIAVGEKEVEELKQRYSEYKNHFPKLKLLDREEIAEIEPTVIEGRNNDPIIALYSEEGYAVDYGKTSKAFVEDSKKQGVDVYLNTKLLSITRDEKTEEKNYFIKTDKEDFESKIVVICAGAHSLLIAQSLNYGKEFGLLCVAGSFYNSKKVLNGKVYTMQLKKLPFAAVHGDPEVHNHNITRFGPTAKPIFMLERYNYKTVKEYFKGFGWKHISVIAKLMTDSTISKYIIRNFFYDFPIIGKRLFLKEARKVVPKITLKDITYAKGYGGNRPQIINLHKKTLDTGEAKIIGDNIIFNITPSPGASTCLGNAYKDAELIVDFLKKSGSKHEFHKKEMEKKFT